MVHATTYVGLDVHKRDIAVAMLVPGSSQPVEWTIANELRAVRRLARKLKRESSGGIECAYEAGACGYTLQRQLRAEGISCRVVAPSLIPKKPGQHIKTDRRDARKLAELLRAGLLTEVHPPTPEEESVRDLCRCRLDAQADLTRARQRLGHLLLRRGRIYTEGRNWTTQHRAWLRTLSFDQPAEKAAFEDYLRAVEFMEERLQGLAQQIEDLAKTEAYAERVGWLRCFRGIDTVTAMIILSELHDFGRFGSPRQLMAYLGLVPREHSSGDTRRRGGITKAGNAHVRRVLIEVAWHCRKRPAVGVALRHRRFKQPKAVIAIADRAQDRLYRRWNRLVLGRGKSSTKATAAVARELVGFLWATLFLYPQEKQLAAAA
jgi:transposase